MQEAFQKLLATFQPTIFTWEYFCDFDKIIKNTFAVKLQLNILNSLLGEKDIEAKFLEIIKEYPQTRAVLPLLLAVRDPFEVVLDSQTKQILQVAHLFDQKIAFNNEMERSIIAFF